jgi:hypothetical protein
VQEGWGSWLRMSKQKRQEFKYFRVSSVKAKEDQIMQTMINQLN